MSFAPNAYPTSTPLGRAMHDGGWQVNDLVRLTGVDRWRYNDYLAGRRVPTPEILAKIASALGVSPGALV